MTPFVLDCSVSAAWCLRDETSARAERLLEALGETEAMVPAQWVSEMANVLVVAERRGRIDRRDVTGSVRLLGLLPVRVVAAEPDSLGRLIETARDSGLSAYDASYLELARRLGLPLATFDEQLGRAADRAGVTRV